MLVCDILDYMTDNNIIIHGFQELRFAGTQTIQGVNGLLLECDDDFTPKLSTRHDCHHLDFNDDTGSLYEFMYSLMREHVAVAFVDGKVAAVAVYDDNADSTYLALILTGRDYRGLKLASRLYDYVERNAVNGIVRLRISSGNTTQLAILDKRGYKQLHTIENDRADGLHTIYFEKNMKDSVLTDTDASKDALDSNSNGKDELLDCAL